MRENITILNSRHGIATKALRWVFTDRTFIDFIVAYVVIALVSLEILIWNQVFSGFIPTWTLPRDGLDIQSLLGNVPSNLIAVQVGVLGVISIAVGLVTIITQREGASTDVKLYYHESLAFGVVASCVALLAVLCLQLFWPFSILLSSILPPSQLEVFKFALLVVHLIWLLLNLWALAEFISVTFRFVQQSAREALRERYTPMWFCRSK